jgi:hypothetical protein
VPPTDAARRPSLQQERREQMRRASVVFRSPRDRSRLHTERPTEANYQTYSDATEGRRSRPTQPLPTMQTSALISLTTALPVMPNPAAQRSSSPAGGAE